MKTKTITLYEFDELPTEKAKDRARDWWRTTSPQDDDYWWQDIYEDAEQIGLKIKDFDLCGRTIEGKFIREPDMVAHLILANHGKHCATHMLATEYREACNKVFDERREAEAVDKAFLKDLCHEYLTMLLDSYDHFLSDENVDELLRVNGCTFTEDGKRID